MSEHKHTNHLIHETSPYLLQHAHNPVNWFAWSEEVLKKAKQEDKPILVSIGYAACHWCHVMERESFENEETAALMNRYFVNIKIDREERPDLDHIYMDAVQAISGGGGWPLNVFLLPDGRPFYGGTYFPPVPVHNRMSWTELLTAIHNMFTEKRREVETQAENLLNHISSASTFLQTSIAEDSVFQEENLATINHQILQNADVEWGGFGRAPKFPQTFTIQNLLQQYYYTGDENSIRQALLSLDCMIGGGIYDQLGGGFARYSTDAKWLAPHFEKMLYDNALLITTLAEAYQLTGKKLYADVIRQTIEFIKREMQLPEGGCYSALDADSEGVEGKFYTWSKREIESVLGDDAEFFCRLYNVTERGNWEHTNILWLSHNADWQQEIADHSIREKIEACKQKLMAVRETRVRPQRDDKIILGWNALLISACCQAYAALGEPALLNLATQTIDFLENNLYKKGKWQHSWKSGKSNHTAFLDDYACLIQAYIHLQEVTGQSDYLLKAKELTEYVINHFTNPDSALLYYTPDYQLDVVVRKTEVYDGATPAGNSIMARCFYYLSIVFEKGEWRNRSQAMLKTLAEAIIQYPTSFGVWVMLYRMELKSTNEIVITGEHAAEKLQEILKHFIPNKVVQLLTTKTEDARFSLLKDRFQPGKTLIYICHEGVCKTPVEKTEDALELLQ